MIEILSGLATLLFILVAGFVGLRLVWVSRRTKGFPEFAFGAGLTLVVLVGYPLLLAGRANVTTAPDLARWLMAAAAMPMAIGWTAVWIFTWRVFRPDSAGARLVTLAAVGITLAFGLAGVHASLSWRAGVPDFARLSYTGPSLMAILSYAWGAFEAFAYHGRMRKRVALGLADRVLANRFLLWGLVMVFSATSTAVPTLATLTGVDSIRSAPVLLASAFAGISCSVSLWLAFVPPAIYVRFVRREVAPAT